MAQVLLKQFLSDALHHPFAWGTHDCMMFVANWAHRATGLDPADGWRGTYACEAGARDILARAGGEAAHMSARLRPCGWLHSDQECAQAGDILLATLPRHHEPLAGLAVGGGRAAFLTSRGLLIWRASALASWHHPEVRSNG